MLDAMSREQRTPAQVASDELDTEENPDQDEVVTQARPAQPRAVFERQFAQTPAHEANSEDVTIDEDEAPTARRR